MDIHIGEIVDDKATCVFHFDVPDATNNATPTPLNWRDIMSYVNQQRDANGDLVPYRSAAPDTDAAELAALAAGEKVEHTATVGIVYGADPSDIEIDDAMTVSRIRAAYIAMKAEKYPQMLSQYKYYGTQLAES